MWDRRNFLRTSLLAGAAVLAGSYESRAQAGPVYPAHSMRVRDLVGRSTVIDMLGLLTLDWAKLRAWESRPDAFGEDDLALLRNSGVSVFHPAVDPNAADPHGAAMRWIKGWRGLCVNQERHFLPVLQPCDLGRARDEGRIGVMMGFQSSEHFRTVDDVAAFHALGQRVSQLTYNGRSRFGSGCKDARDLGLSSFGTQIVAAMNACGMTVDVSHCSERTTLDAIECSTRPVLVTHSNCQAIVRHPRNKSDRVLKALARSGGVIGITTVRAYVGGRASISDLLDHFEHVARVAGIEHVGIGSDCDPDPRHPVTGRPSAAYAIDGLNHPRRVFDIADGLLRRGYCDDDVALVLGGNFRRVLNETWSAAA